jgi:hypothetical protein
MALRVIPDPARLALYRVPLGNLIEAVSQANRAFPRAPCAKADRPRWSWRGRRSAMRRSFPR